MANLSGKAKRVSIWVNEGDRVGHQPAPLAVLEFLRRENTAGATVFRGIEGFGGSGEIHTSRLVDVQWRLPILIEWIDTQENVERLLPRVKEMVKRGLITVDDTEVVLYNPHPVRDVAAALTAVEVMSRDVASVTKEAPIKDVVELMLGKVYRAVPVLESGVPIGIITNSDLVNRGGLAVRMELLPSLDTPELHAELERLTRNHKTAEEIMTAGPVTVNAKTTLREVAEIMVHRHLKRLPVVDDHDVLVGMISRLDLLRTAAQAFEPKEAAPRAPMLSGDVPLSRVMRRDVPTVHPETPLSEVMQAVISTRLNRAIVVDGAHRVVGVVTDEELLDRVTPSLRPSAIRSLMHRLPFMHPNPEELRAEQHATARTAAGLMSTDVATARQGAPLREAIATMLRGTHKLVAVVDGDSRLVGVVDRADILRGLVQRGIW